MKLPTIDQPVYELKLLSIDKPVHYRPFLVKEQKIMMMAAESKDIDTVIKSIKQIIQNCVVEPIDVEELPLADMETLFLNLRARSMGEVLNLYFKCTNQVPDIRPDIAASPPMMKECGMIIEVPVNLLEVKQINTDKSKKIMLTESVGVIMKYPALSVVNKVVESEDDSVIFTLAAACLDQIFDKENVYKAKDATSEELISFLENLPTDAFEMIEDFINHVPKSKYETKKICPKCSYEHNFVLEGLADFFI